MSTRFRRLRVQHGVIVFVVGVLTAACTSEDLEPPVARTPAHLADAAAHRRGPDDEGSGGRGALFISPSGEPFRSRASAPYPVVVWFNQADTDKDGRLTGPEFRADAERFFHVLDLNRDGVLEPAEIDHYEREIVPEILGRHAQTLSSAGGRSKRIEGALAAAQVGGPGGGGGGGRGHGGQGESEAPSRSDGPRDTSASEGAGPYGLLGEPEPVTSADGNFDGKITLGEFGTRADQHFQVLDERGRGYLLLAELPETAVQARGSDGRRRSDRRRRRG